MPVRRSRNGVSTNASEDRATTDASPIAESLAARMRRSLEQLHSLTSRSCSSAFWAENTRTHALRRSHDQDRRVTDELSGAALALLEPSR